MDRLIAHTFAAFYPSIDGLRGLDTMDGAAFVQKIREESPPLFWLGILAGTAVFQLSPLLTVGWPVPAFLLPAHVRDRHAHNMSGSRIYLVRQCSVLLKMGASFCWASDPALRAQWGLPLYEEDPGTFRPSSEDAR